MKKRPARPPKRLPKSELSPFQREVWELIAKGLTNEEIVANLSPKYGVKSVKSVENAFLKICDKLDIDKYGKAKRYNAIQRYFAHRSKPESTVEVADSSEREHKTVQNNIRAKEEAPSMPQYPEQIMKKALTYLWEDIDETLDLLIMAALIERTHVEIDGSVAESPVLRFLWSFVRNYRWVANAARSYDPRGWSQVVESRAKIDKILKDVSLSLPGGADIALEMAWQLQHELGFHSECIVIPPVEEEASYMANSGVVQVRLDIEGVLSLIEGILLPDSHDPYFDSALFCFEIMAGQSWNKQFERRSLPETFSKALRLIALCYMGQELSHFRRTASDASFFMSWSDYVNRFFRWEKEFKRTSRWLGVFPTFPGYKANTIGLPRTGKETVSTLLALCQYIRESKMLKASKDML
jgi:DNA-binding CsgD family transcriptional regulator